MNHPFIRKFYAGIGSRQTPPDILRLMGSLAVTLGEHGYTLRSGGAPGADQAFEQVISEFPAEIYLPWNGFEGRRYGHEYLRWNPEAYEIAAQYHPAWDKLGRGGKAMMASNVHQVLGQDLKTPSEFLVCWTKDGKATGGTGMAMRIAADPAHNIPIFNLRFQVNLAALIGYLRSR